MPLPKSKYEPVQLADGSWELGDWVFPACSELTILCKGFSLAQSPEEKEYFFWRIADALWNSDPDPRNHVFARHRWSHQMIRDACHEKYLAVGGAASGGKSYVFAGWALVCWLSDPANTKVLMTSTHLAGARDRIWGAVMKLIGYIPNAPCRIRDSIGSITYYDGTKQGQPGGLKLVAADKSQSKSKIGKLIGGKAPKVILIADELGEISENVQEGAVSNLASNPSFQMIGLSNPASRFDPFGVFSQPKLGWDSVNMDVDFSWRTKLGGLYRRYDSEDSPNINRIPSPEYDCGNYPYLPTREKIDAALDELGATRDEARKSRGFMRMHRAVFFDSEGADTYYSETELVRAGALVSTEIKSPTRVAGVDPSFSSGGDKTVMTILDVGYDVNGQFAANVVTQLTLYEDVTDKKNPRSLQLAEKIKAICLQYEVAVEHLGIDASGPSGTFCDMLQLQWMPGFLRVQFGGAASDRRVMHEKNITGKDRFRNRASELFFLAKQYLLGRQLFNIPAAVVKQMCARGHTTTKGVMGLVLQVEPKREYKARVGASPDETDSLMVALETARSRVGFTPLPPVQRSTGDGDSIAHWLRPKTSFRGLQASALGHCAHLG